MVYYEFYDIDHLVYPLNIFLKIVLVSYVVGLQVFLACAFIGGGGGNLRVILVRACGSVFFKPTPIINQVFEKK